MKKFLLTLAAAVLSLGVASATEYTADFTAVSASSGDVSLKVGENDVTFTLDKCTDHSKDKYLMINKGTKTAEGGSIAFSLPFDCSKINFVSRSGASTTVTLNLYANGTKILSNIKIANVTGVDFDIPEGSQKANTKYKLVVSNDKNAQLTKLIFTAAEGTSVVPKTDASLSWSVEDAKLNLGEAFVAPVLTATPAEAMASVKYSTSNPSLLAVNADGSFKFTEGVTGKAVITAEIPATDESYKPAKAEYTLTVVDPNAIVDELDVDFNSDFTTTYKQYPFTGQQSGVSYIIKGYKSGGIQINTAGKNNAAGSAMITKENNTDYVIASVVVESTQDKHDNIVLDVANAAWTMTGAESSTASSTIAAATTETVTVTGNASTDGKTVTFTVNGDYKYLYLHTTANTIFTKITVNYRKVAKLEAVATPVIELNEGIVMSCDTEGATIWYTNDGSEPEANGATSFEYKAAIELPNVSTTYKAIAVKDGMKDSEVAVYNYVVTVKTEVANFVLDGTDYSWWQPTLPGLANIQALDDDTDWTADGAAHNNLHYGVMKLDNVVIDFSKASAESNEVARLTPIGVIIPEGAKMHVYAAVDGWELSNVEFIGDDATDFSANAGMFNGGSWVAKADAQAQALAEGDAETPLTEVVLTANGSNNVFTGVKVTMAENEAAKAPKTTGVRDIISGDDNNAPVEYFNLQGVRVSNPAAGGLYIKRQGTKTAKVRF